MAMYQQPGLANNPTVHNLPNANNILHTNVGLFQGPEKQEENPLGMPSFDSLFQPQSSVPSSGGVQTAASSSNSVLYNPIFATQDYKRMR